MRAAPAVSLSVTRFGVWRGAVGSVLALVWVVVGAWLVSQAQATGDAPDGSKIAVALVALVAATVCAARLWAVRHFDLRWDGKSWHLHDSPTTDAVPGDLVPQIDLGDWLLLHFTAEQPAPRRTSRWLPVQRRGHEAVWHALRCAVHSPRPPAPDAGAVD